MTFDSLPDEVANVLTRALEDTLDQHIDGWGNSDRGYYDSATVPALIDHLLELGWTPPAVTS